MKAKARVYKHGGVWELEYCNGWWQFDTWRKAIEEAVWQTNGHNARSIPFHIGVDRG